MSSTPKSFPIAEPADKRHGRADLQLNPAVMVLLRSWKLVAAVTIATVVMSAAFATFGMTKFYRAEAILRPVSELMPNEFALAASDSSADMAPPEIGSLLGVPRAQEIVTILSSFDFSVAMVERHHLRTELLSASGWRRGSDPQWDAFRELKRRFNCEFSFTTGNVTLYYLAPDRANAQRDLGYYLDDLRRKLREEQIRNSATAIESLREEAKATSDSLLQARIYRLIAAGLQAQKLAMVEADFAFKVIENPAASDRPYSPNPLLVTGLAGVVGLFLCCLALLTRDWLGRIRASDARDSAPLVGKRREANPIPR